MKPTVDSGAIDTICGKRHVDPTQIKETAASRRGMTYVAANDGSIRNIGEADMCGENEDGNPFRLTTQVGDKVNKFLLSVRNCKAAGNMTIFGASIEAIRELAKRDSLPEDMMVNRKTGGISKIHDEDGAYKLPLWVKRPIRKGSVNAGLGNKSLELLGEGEDDIDMIF